MGTLDLRLPFTSEFEEDGDLLRLAASIRETAFNTPSTSAEFLLHSGRYTWMLQAARHGYFLAQEVGHQLSYIAAIQSFHKRGYGEALFLNFAELRQNHMGLPLRMLKVLIANDLEEAHQAIGGDYPLKVPAISVPFSIPELPMLEKYLRAA